MVHYDKRHFTWILIGLMLVCGCAKKDVHFETLAAQPDLSAHSAEFKKEVIRVTDGVYVAIGYGLANAILLEGEDGAVLVDTMESEEAAREVKKALAAVCSKPIRAIIYTHFHSDHTNGASVFDPDGDIDIYAHARTLYNLNRIVSVTRETTYRRAMRQFGTFLPPGGLVNAGIGPFLYFNGQTTAGLMFPTKTFEGERMRLDVVGLKLELVHAPGETDDQIYIWIPEKKVLLPADNFYKSFPNLYAIRGTAYRDVTQWAKSLDKMRDLRPDYLVPSHTRPLIGEKKIYETLTNYRDAIQYVHDQTIRGINMGLTPEELVDTVKLPPHLASQPYLHEYYGTVAWSVRAIFDGYLGWFGGNATDLFPLSPKERALRYADLAGGTDALLQAADTAAANGDHQWVLELTDYLLRLDPEMEKAVNLRASALQALGEKQIVATARNYYLTQALEADGRLTIEKRKIKEMDVVHAIPLATIFNAMPVHLDPEKSADVDQTVCFRFPDANEAYTVHVRRGVAEIRPRASSQADIVVTVPADIWKELAAGVRSPALSLVKGDLDIQGGTFDLVSFLKLFR